MASGPPPRPPPHGQAPRPPNAMPDGNYDIFIIPPHSAGGGFLYLPSLAPNRNSFLAGFACAVVAALLWMAIVPVLKQWLSSVMASGGVGMLLLVIGVGVASWAWGKTQGENSNGPGAGGGSSAGANQQQHQSSGPPPTGHAPPPRPNAPPPPKPSAASGWEKAKEETKKREEARKREDEANKRKEAAEKAKEDAAKAAKADAEKTKWEQQRAREKEQRELKAREKIAEERRAKEAAEKVSNPREKAGYTSSAHSSPKKTYHKPTARSVGTEDEYSYRPYDKKPAYKSSASSISGLSEESYAPSHSTARTTPPPSQRGPYSTKDPDKIKIKAVYLFSDSFPMKPIQSLISKSGPVTDGLILKIMTEGLFIDDDIRGVPQREWDVKAWTLKLVEDGMTKNAAGQGLHVLRATARDAENKKYTFILDETEAWKVAVGLARLRKGSQVRALGMNGMKESEVRGLLSTLGWL